MFGRFFTIAIFCCLVGKPGLTAASEPAAGDSQWGTVKGRVVWSKKELPKRAELAVTKDEKWCLAKGPLHEETFVVDEKSRGIKHVFAYLRRPSAIHPSFANTAKDVEAEDLARFKKENGIGYEELSAAIENGKIKVGDIKCKNLVDQVRCVYVPHAMALREGERVVFLNQEEVAHNVKVASLTGKNDENRMMRPGSVLVSKWSSENQPLAIECNIHGWMRMNAMVFDHPYFAVTGTDGSFELKNVPAGEVTLVLRKPEYIDPLKGGRGTARGGKVNVPAGGVVDLGEIKFSD